MKILRDLIIGGLEFLSGAILQIDSTTKGVLIPRMTTTQRDAISSPAISLLIFNSTTNQYEYFEGSVWIGINTNSTTIIPTAASTTVLDNNSTNNFIFTGSTFGKVMNLGNATTYYVGKTKYFYNNSTQTISIVNNASVEIYRLEPYCKLEILLQDNSTSDGIWIFTLTYPNYDKLILVLDDFISGTGLGQTNWVTSVTGAGSSIIQTTSLFGKKGVLQLSTGTSNTGRSCLNKGGNIFLFDNGLTVLEQSIRFEDLSTATDRYTFYAGYGDNVAAGDMLDGVYFEYAEGTSGNFWRIKSSNNNTKTITVTTSPILADTWYNLKIEIAPSGTRADFFVNGVNIGNIINNIPIATGRNTGILFKTEKLVGGTARLVYVDYANFKGYRL